MCNMQALIVNSTLHIAEDREVAEETLTFEFIPFFSNSSISGLTYPSQIQGQEGVSSVSKTFADDAPSN